MKTIFYTFQANDAYLEMAIGNAPWPIGVTMVGIHARTGREKISSRYVAHVLNDETQRKYMQVSQFYHCIILSDEIIRIKNKRCTMRHQATANGFHAITYYLLTLQRMLLKF